MFTDYAGADTTPEGDGTEIVTPLEDVEEPEAQPEDTPGEPEKETKSLMEGGEGEGSPEQEQPESEEPAGEVNETEEKEADVPNANKGADESGANSKGIVARSQTLAAETNAAAALSADLELMIGNSEELSHSSDKKYDNYRWKVTSGGNVVKIVSKQGEKTSKKPYVYSNNVTAIGAGTATIEFQTSGDLGLIWKTRQTWTIEVAAPILTGITIGGSDTVAEFASVNLTAKLSPNGAVGQVVWASDDPSVATVDDRGRVTGVAEGEVTIRASATNPDGTSVTAEHEITVTRSQASQEADFYYLKSPNSNPDSNGTGEWGDEVGTGKVDLRGAVWVNEKNCFISSQQNRVVEWPDGFEDGVVPRESPHWKVIFDAYKGTVEGGNVTEDDIESITLVPYKISSNDRYHVDCTVVVKAKNLATVKFWLCDAGKDQYAQQYAQTVRANTQVSIPEVLSKLPKEKTVDGRKYRLVAWRTAPDLTGSDVAFPHTVTENVNFYAKYVADYIVTYELDGGSWSVKPQKFYAAGNTVTIPATKPTKNGYEFKGWKLSTDSAYIDSGGTFAMPAQDVTLTAQWEKRADLSYIINYYRDSIAEENRIDEAVVIDEQTFGDTVTLNQVTIDSKRPAGYQAGFVTPQSLVIKAEGNVFNVVYTKRTDLSYTVNYLEQGTGKVLHEAKTVDGQTFGAEVTESAIDVAGYNKVDPASATITIGTEGNVINFYYTKRTDLSYTVNYLEQGTGKVLHEAKTVDGQTFGAEVTESAIDITGYNKIDPTDATITIAVKGNEINFYYAKRTDLSYTVNYLKAEKNPITEEITVVKDKDGKPVSVAESVTRYNKTYREIYTETAVDVNGYSVEGLGIEGVVVDADNKILDFYYTADAAKIAFEENGGSAVADMDGVTAQAIGNTAMPETTRAGYDFQGWYDNRELSGEPVEALPSAFPAGTTTYYAKWAEDRTDTVEASYTVEYYKGAELAETETVTERVWAAEPGTVPVTASKINTTDKFAGYTFDRTDPATLPKTIAADGTIKVYYTADAAKIAFEENGGSAVADMDGVTAQAIGNTAMPETTRAGYDFQGWYDNRELSGEPVEALPSAFPAGTTTYYAKWAEDRTDTVEASYTVEYYKGAELAETENVTERVWAAEPGTVPVTASKINTTDKFAGYTFDRTDPATLPKTIAADGTIKVYYERLSYDLTYSYMGDVIPAGAQEWLDQNAPTDPVLFEGTVTVLDEPEIPGYTFNGWTTQDAVVAQDGTFSMPANNVRFTGSWVANGNTGYTVNYFQQNVTGTGYTQVDSQSLTGATDTPATASIRGYEGFTYNAARSNVTGNIAGDGSLVLNVYYDRNVYTVTYQYTGTVPAGASALPATQSYRYGETFAIAPDATAAGYTFSGWGVTGNMTMGGSNIVLTGSFTAVTTVVPTPTPVVPTAPVVTPAAVTPAPAPATPAVPATPAPAAPAPAAAPAAATPAPATEPIEDDATPQAAAPSEGTPLAETEEIEDEATPMGAFDEPHCWVHWVMLLGILITAAYGLVVVRRRLHLADDVDDYEKQVLGIEDEAPEAVPADGRQAL